MLVALIGQERDTGEVSQDDEETIRRYHFSLLFDSLLPFNSSSSVNISVAFQVFDGSSYFSESGQKAS